ncbi:MAG: hypothetical protein IJ471_09395 [Eubacterium sp.]|nr:hypothetical protein [Eubacterium sp.]
MITNDKTSLWLIIKPLIENLPDSEKTLDETLLLVSGNQERLRFLMDKTIGATNDQRMVNAMKRILMHGGQEILQKDEGFKKNLMKKAQTHENQFVVIYEDWIAAEAYLKVYLLLEKV